MKNVFEWLAARQDKVLHFVACLLIALVVGVLDVKIFAREVAVAATIGGLTSVFVGICKEVVDFMRARQFSGGDLVADLWGAVAGALLVVLIFV